MMSRVHPFLLYVVGLTTLVAVWCTSRGAKRDFIMVSSSFSPASVEVAKERATLITFIQNTRVETTSDSDARVGVVDRWRDMGEGFWHLIGPGLGSVSGLRLLPRPRRNVVKKFRPSMVIRIFLLNAILLCIAPDPRNPPFGAELIAFLRVRLGGVPLIRGTQIIPGCMGISTQVAGQRTPKRLAIRDTDASTIGSRSVDGSKAGARSLSFLCSG